MTNPQPIVANLPTPTPDEQLAAVSRQSQPNNPGLEELKPLLAVFDIYRAAPKITPELLGFVLGKIATLLTQERRQAKLRGAFNALQELGLEHWQKSIPERALLDKLEYFDAELKRLQGEL